MFVEVALLALIFLCYGFLQNKRPNGYPPGPKGFPFLGNILQIGVHPFKTFHTMKASYGNIIGLKGPGILAVVLNDPTVIREALNMAEFSARCQCPAMTSRFGGIGNKGLVFNEGKALFEQRRFVLKTLRNFGYNNKTSSELSIQLEITQLITKLVKLNGKPFQPKHDFNSVVVNSLWTIVAGRRFEYGDKKLLRVVHLLERLGNEMPFSGAFLFFPTIYNLAPEFTGYKGLMDTSNEILQIVREEYNEHIRAFQKDEPRDYLDCYIQENFGCVNKDSSFFGTEGENNLLLGLWDLFSAGVETTSSTLAWAFLYLSVHPRVQEKMYEEIKNVVGISRLPSLSDRPNMPYSEATLMEILRKSSLVPFSVIHRAMETAQIHGFTIPKGTIIIPNLYGIHHDPEIWGDPHTFRPERFITEEGQVKSHKALLPFGIGKRACIGESLAKDQLFLILTSLVQKFKIQFNPAKPTPDIAQFKFSLFLLLPKSTEYILIEHS